MMREENGGGDKAARYPRAKSLPPTCSKGEDDIGAVHDGFN
jgi:hypothetical protein